MACANVEKAVALVAYVRTQLVGFGSTADIIAAKLATLS